VLRRILGIAVVALAGGSPLWSQQPPEAEARDGPDPSSYFRLRTAGRWSSPALPDAPSTVSAAAASDGDVSSSSSVPAPPPAAKPGYDADASAVVRPAEKPPSSQKFHWAPALRQSLLFLGVEHGFRLGTQRYTRKNTVEGPFFQDWFDSARGTLSQWDDHDSFWGNYVGHPIQGATAGYIQIQNDPRGIKQEFGRSSQYWKSRMRATAWSTAFSTQFELGPLGEATVGNVGKRKGAGGAQDLVVTPMAGLGWMVTEDALDKYVIRSLEQKSHNRGWKAMARTVLNPSRSFANLMRRKAPWHRDTRDGVAAAGDPARPPAPRPAAAAPPAAAPAPPADSAKQSCSQPCQ
jgi:hypothetical protein